MRLLHLSPGEISPNLWYLAPNPASRAFSTAYPYLMGCMFLASFPFTILARTISTSAVALLCCPQPNTGEECYRCCRMGVCMAWIRGGKPTAAPAKPASLFKLSSRSACMFVARVLLAFTLLPFCSRASSMVAPACTSQPLHAHHCCHRRAVFVSLTVLYHFS